MNGVLYIEKNLLEVLLILELSSSIVSALYSYIIKILGIEEIERQVNSLPCMFNNS